MGMAIDTVAFSATNPGAGGAAAAAVSGDSLTTRNFAGGTKAYLDFLTRQGAAAGFLQVTSPTFADNVHGLYYYESETPAVELMPQETAQPIAPGDALGVTISGGAAEVDGGALGFYYQDAPGVSAVLRDWSEISPNVANVKPVRVTCTTAAAALVWADTLINATQNDLKSDRYYAVLGYTVDAATAACGVKGAFTGNLRAAGPGTTSTLRTSDYFVRMNREQGRPYIPVFNGNDRGAVYVSLSAVATGATINVTVNLVELVKGYTAS